MYVDITVTEKVTFRWPKIQNAQNSVLNFENFLGQCSQPTFCYGLSGRPQQPATWKSFTMLLHIASVSFLRRRFVRLHITPVIGI